jgi:hypothetical protein
MLPLLTLFLACMQTDPARTHSTLIKAGFTNVQVGGYAWGECGEGDIYATEFTAVNPQGLAVSGVVCCGSYKRCTVRF